MADFLVAGEGGGEGERGGVTGTPLEAVLRQMPAGVIVAEAPSGRLLLGNRQIETIWRRPFPPSDQIATYAGWRGYHPDGRPYAAGEWPLARSIASGEVVEGEEIEIERGDGTRGVICMNSSPIRDDNDRIVAGVVTASDITEQRRQGRLRGFLSEATALLFGSLDYETTLRNVAELAVPELADWCNVDIVRENGRIERLVVEHVDAAKAERARRIAQQYPPNSSAASGVGRVVRTGEPELIPEIDDAFLRGVARGAEHLEFLREIGLRSAMILPLRGREKTLGVIVFLSAESGRRYGPDDLAQAHELAMRAGIAIDNARLYHESQAANRAKSDFLAVISHELRTPLTAIIGYSELLGLGVPEPLTARQQEQVGRIEVSAHHLLHLIEEILGLVSLESGQTRPAHEQVGLDEVLHRVEVILEPMARAKDLTLATRATPGLTVETDPDHLVQVFINLLGNAIKFTDEGSVELDARRAGDELLVEVRDTGIGMSDAERAKIFEPFWQAEEPITRRAGGTGLGLTITRRLLNLLGGRIEVESAPGAGSTFRVWIPLRAAPQSRST